MNDINQILKSLLTDPAKAVDPDWVARLADRYPAFYFPTALLVKRNMAGIDKSRLDSLLTYLVVQSPDRAAVADFTGNSGADWSNFYPKTDTLQETSTDRTIDAFINTYGHSSPQEDALLERLIFSPVPADYLGAPDTPLDPSDPLVIPPELDVPVNDDIKATLPVAPPPFKGLRETEIIPPPFTGLQKSTPSLAPDPATAPGPAPAPAAPDPVPAPDADTSLMESLAKFFIKKGRYERAYDIISDLSLKFPEKSVYFAEQLRFLQKKILSQKLSQENKTKNQE